MQHWPPDIVATGANLRARAAIIVRQSAWQGSCKHLESGCRLRPAFLMGVADALAVALASST